MLTSGNYLHTYLLQEEIKLSNLDAQFLKITQFIGCRHIVHGCKR